MHLRIGVLRASSHHIGRVLNLSRDDAHRRKRKLKRDEQLAATIWRCLQSWMPPAPASRITILKSWPP